MAELLVRNLPRKLVRLQTENCERENGTRSIHRTRIEVLSLARLRTKVTCLLFALVIPNLFLVWLINQELIPVAVAAETAASYQADHSAWQTELVDKNRFSRWKQQTRLPIGEQQHRSLLSRYFSLVLGTVAVWLILCCATTASRYLYLLRDYEVRLRARAQQYYFRDMGRMQDNFRTAANPPKESYPGMGELASTS